MAWKLGLAIFLAAVLVMTLGPMAMYVIGTLVALAIVGLLVSLTVLGFLSSRRSPEGEGMAGAAAPDGDAPTAGPGHPAAPQR